MPEFKHSSVDCITILAGLHLLFTIFTGISIAIGSWIALSVLLASRILNRAGDIAEDQSCLDHYGDSYREYMEQVPRYLLVGGCIKKIAVEYSP